MPLGLNSIETHVLHQLSWLQAGHFLNAFCCCHKPSQEVHVEVNYTLWNADCSKNMGDMFISGYDLQTVSQPEKTDK